MSLSFGALDDQLRQANADLPDIMASAGPVSDAFILGTEPMMLLNGPQGSGKTIACCKKALLETTRIVPWHSGDHAGTAKHSIRRYVLTIWREKYNLLWGATIPSWQKVFKLAWFPHFSGSSGRPAEHLIEWEDIFGPCQLVARFRAFGDVADPDDVRGSETTDAYFNEWDTMAEELSIAIAGRVAREPPRKVLGRPGRLFGDCNAPDVLNFMYRDFFEELKTGYKLYRQPGGFEEGAENPSLGREYYEDQVLKNAHRQWWVRRMIHNKPGFTRDSDVVFPAYDDDVHLSKERLQPIPSLRVIIGVDGGNTPSAVYMQETPLGQLRILDCITTEASGMKELAAAMLRLEAERYTMFRAADFDTIGDPSMRNGEETEEGSDRSRLAKHLGRKVQLAGTNDPEKRLEPMRGFIQSRTSRGDPGLLLDPTCKPIRRGFNQTFAYHRVRGTNERSRIIKNPDSHPCEAACYGAMATGKGRSNTVIADRAKRQADRAKRNDGVGRYNPFDRRVSEGRKR